MDIFSFFEPFSVTLEIVVHENPSRSAVFEILRPARLAPTTIPLSKSLLNPLFFPILMLGLNFSKSSSPHLDALSCCHVIGWLAICVTKWPVSVYIYIYIYIYMKSSFPKRDKAKLKKMSSSCHFAVYWTYSLLHQCFMPNRYISLFKMYCKMQFFSKPL